MCSKARPTLRFLKTDKMTEKRPQFCLVGFARRRACEPSLCSACEPSLCSACEPSLLEILGHTTRCLQERCESRRRLACRSCLISAPDLPAPMSTSIVLVSTVIVLLQPYLSYTYVNCILVTPHLRYSHLIYVFLCQLDTLCLSYWIWECGCIHVDIRGAST